MINLNTFAEAVNPADANASGDIFTALGIDWRLLILQIIAFIILVWALSKWVYPLLMKAVDQRQADIESAAKAAKEAQQTATETQEETARLLEEAKKQASDIVATAKLEATEITTNSETKARDLAEKIASDAREQLAKDVEAAKRDLYNETLQLVALTTEKVIGVTHSNKADDVLIADLLKSTKEQD